MGAMNESQDGGMGMCESRDELPGVGVCPFPLIGRWSPMSGARRRDVGNVAV
jgi:hypothetical protein